MVAEVKKETRLADLRRTASELQDLTGNLLPAYMTMTGTERRDGIAIARFIQKELRDPVLTMMTENMRKFRLTMFLYGIIDLEVIPETNQMVYKIKNPKLLQDLIRQMEKEPPKDSPFND